MSVKVWLLAAIAIGRKGAKVRKEQMRHERRRGLPGRFWQRTSLNREDFLKPKSIGQAAPSIIMPFETFWTGYYDCHKKLW